MLTLEAQLVQDMEMKLDQLIWQLYGSCESFDETQNK
eukprot:06140.XXX_55032_55142_1 [CDS] Oithona nana genome sequencing.